MTKNLLLTSLAILIITGCTGSPEKSFVYQFDGVGQVSCNRGAEESALQQAANVISTLGKGGADLFTALSRGMEERSTIDPKTLNALIASMQVETKMKTLETAFEVCKKMNEMK